MSKSPRRARRPRPWAICDDCSNMRAKCAEKDALLREALSLCEYRENWSVKMKEELARRIRESLGNPPKQEGGE